VRAIRIYQVDAFTKEKFQGNPAGVVTNADGLTESQMQAIARELNNPETAFILPPTAPDHDVWVRFFTPTTEVPSCGHATIAAHYARAVENGLSSCTVIQKIGIGMLPVEIIAAEGDYRIVMTQGTIEIEEPFADAQRHDIVAALGLTQADLDERCPVQIVSTGHSKVMVGIRTRAKLHALKPDLARLTEISAAIGCNGYFVFTLDSDSEDILTHGRMFAPAIGIPEDPVTGNANGPLGAYLTHHRRVPTDADTFAFQGRQGQAMGRPGTVEVTVQLQNGAPSLVRVAGRATIAFQGRLQL
jgi:PhzF family phenazine biosynthesis protein